MAVQTERITILGSPDFKFWLEKEAEKEGISLSELVRKRCQHKANEDELLLAALVAEVKKATKKAKASLNKGIKDAEIFLSEVRKDRK
jgi:hypothetical protein